MKLKDYFTKLKDQAKIVNEDFDKFLATVPEGEIPDPMFAVIEDNFITPERAKTDKRVEGHVRSHVLNAVDEIIEEMLPSLSIFNAADIKANTNTFKRLAMLKDSINDTIEKEKKNKPSNDEKVKAAEKALQEAAEKAKKDKDTYEKALQDERLRVDREVKDTKLNYALEKKISKYKLADEYEEDREIVTDVILTKIGKNILDFNDKGEILVQEIVNGVHQPKFNGNDQVTIDKLLEEATKPYLKKNNGDDAGGQNNNNNGRHIEVPSKSRQAPRTVVKTMQ